MNSSRTRNGYKSDEVASAFQKSIRRGLVDDVLYWGVDLYMSGRAEFAWRRMMIIVSEDIGLGERHLPGTLGALHDAFLNELGRKNSHTEDKRLLFVHAVLLLASAPKSRLCDHAKIYHFASHDQQQRRIPDYALDKHTQSGRDMGRGVEHFFNEGAELANQASVEDPYREPALAMLLGGSLAAGTKPPDRDPNQADDFVEGDALSA